MEFKGGAQQLGEEERKALGGWREEVFTDARLAVICSSSFSKAFVSPQHYLGVS